jgi:predicted MFS family arabinose efflux permease
MSTHAAEHRHDHGSSVPEALAPAGRHAGHGAGGLRGAAGVPVAIWAMVIASFAMGADEFIVAGVIQEISHALSVSLGAVGAFESVYALGVAIGAPLFTVLGARAPRRAMLLAAAGLFVVGNLISALGPEYWTIMVGRVVSAMAHGAFFGIATVFAAELVDPARRGRAIATVFAGATAATVLGAPLGAAVGQTFGWRWTFGSLVVFGAVAIAGLLALLPKGLGARSVHADHHAHPDDGHEALSEADLEGLDAHARMHAAQGGGGHAAPLRAQLAALKRAPVWVTLLMTPLAYGGVFTSYVYIAPQLTDVAGFDERWLTPLLLLFGAGLVIGNLLGGKLADARPRAALVGTIAALAGVLFAMTALIEAPASALVGLFVFGVAAFSVVAPLQLRIVAKAGDAPDVAAAANISAFTLGSAGAIYVGGLAIDGGLGLTSVNWVGGLIAVAGLLLALVSVLAFDRGDSTPAASAHDRPHHGTHAHH